MSNKPSLVVLVGALAVCGPAFAQVHAKSAPAKKLNCGDKYVVGPKDAGRKSLLQTQVDDVMKTKIADVDTCWRKLPADQRKSDVAAVLSIEIDDNGEVQTVEVAGVPAETERCVSVVAAAWDFPSSDVKVDASTFTYPIALKAK